MSTVVLKSEWEVVVCFFLKKQTIQHHECVGISSSVQDHIKLCHRYIPESVPSNLRRQRYID